MSRCTKPTLQFLTYMTYDYFMQSPVDIPQSPDGYSLLKKEGPEAPSKNEPTDVPEAPSKHDPMEVPESPDGYSLLKKEGPEAPSKHEPADVPESLHGSLLEEGPEAPSKHDPMDVPESPDGYSLLKKEGPEAPSGYDFNSNGGYVLGDDGFVEDNPYDYDYQEPYFEPANEEEALIVQLNTKLAVTEISREELE